MIDQGHIDKARRLNDKLRRAMDDLSPLLHTPQSMISWPNGENGNPV
jgi:hypothetical protein